MTRCQNQFRTSYWQEIISLGILLRVHGGGYQEKLRLNERVCIATMNANIELVGSKKRQRNSSSGVSPSCSQSSASPTQKMRVGVIRMGPSKVHNPASETIMLAERSTCLSEAQSREDGCNDFRRIVNKERLVVLE